MTQQFDWEKAMWAELDAKPAVDQVSAAAVWISHITQKVLTDLATRRRDMVLQVLEQDEWDARRLAETIGSRRTTINRLAEEGRRARREGG